MRVVRWYKQVLADAGKLDDALAYYDKELETALSVTDITGNLMRANQTQPGHVAFYDAMHTDLDMILELMERQLRLLKARKVRELADNPPTNTKVTATDIKMMAEADPDVAFMAETVERVKDVYKQYGSLMKALTQRGYTLNNITKIRVANMEEVEV